MTGVDPLSWTVMRTKFGDGRLNRDLGTGEGVQRTRERAGRTYSSEAGYPAKVPHRIGSLHLDAAGIGLLMSAAPAGHR